MAMHGDSIHDYEQDGESASASELLARQSADRVRQRLLSSSTGCIEYIEHVDANGVIFLQRNRQEEWR